jgi:hypothetical protein
MTALALLFNLRNTMLCNLLRKTRIFAFHSRTRIYVLKTPVLKHSNFLTKSPSYNSDASGEHRSKLSRNIDHSMETNDKCRLLNGKREFCKGHLWTGEGVYGPEESIERM